MNNNLAIKLRDVTLEIPAKRRLPHRARRETNGAGAISTQIGGRLSYGRGSSATVTILDDVSITISRGQRVGLIGANGAGKSTLLRVMAGIYFPTRGLAETYGSVSTLFPELLGVRPDATGLENIVLTGILLGLTRKEINRRIPEIIEFTELGDYIYMPIRTYSSGMRTRLVLSIATCISPDILLVDEVIGTGDKNFRLKAKDRLNEMLTSANTLVVVSQSPEIIREFCTEAIWLDRGQVRAVGGVNEVLGEYAADIARPNEGMIADSKALLAAKDGLAGTAVLNWSNDIPITNWEGVHVSGKPRRVTRLILRQRELSGSLPPALGSLSRLTKLDLHGNRLNGPIPPELGQLSNLEVLLLDNNELSGDIPTALARASELRRLNLHNNRLSGNVPAEVGRLLNLEELHIHDNRLTGEMPVELGKLDGLRSLWLSNNRFSGEIPEELARLTGLVQLNLHSNRLSGPIPSELGNLASSLQRLRMAGNRFTGCIPSRLVDVVDSDHEKLGLPICSDT